MNLKAWQVSEKPLEKDQNNLQDGKPALRNGPKENQLEKLSQGQKLPEQGERQEIGPHAQYVENMPLYHHHFS